MNGKVKGALIFFAGVGLCMFVYNAVANSAVPVASTAAKKVTGKA